MVTTAATIDRRIADLRTEIDQFKRRADAAPRWGSPVEMAAAIDLDLDPWQARVLDSQARRMIVLGPRQIGKSTVSGVLGLHGALTRDEALILLIAPAQDQSKELARTIRAMAARSGLATTAHTDQIAPTQLSASRIEFPNGSRIIALPGANEATVRGYAQPDLIVVDEAARLKEETFIAIRPMQVTNPDGRLLLLSTPYVKAGTFYRTWTSETSAWERIRVYPADCPRLTPEFLENERAELPAWVYAREYGGEFSDDDRTVFPAELIASAMDPAVVPLFARQETA